MSEKEKESPLPIHPKYAEYLQRGEMFAKARQEGRLFRIHNANTGCLRVIAKNEEEAAKTFAKKYGFGETKEAVDGVIRSSRIVKVAA